MRFSAAATLFAAPLALAGSLQADLVARGAMGSESVKADNVAVEVSGVSSGSTTEVIIIWVNNGGGAATQTVNSAMSVASATQSAVTHQVSKISYWLRTSQALTSLKVTVGGTAGLIYSPDTIEANIGDMVIFTFESNNHTATQSAFTTPCEKLTGGMDSGFMPNINNTVNPAPQMAMQVTVSTPLCKFFLPRLRCA